MGVIGGIIGGIGSAIIGAKSASKQAKAQQAAADQATEASLMGFNYLKDNTLVNQTQGRAPGAQSSIDQMLGSGFTQGTIGQGFAAQNQIGALLGLGAATQPTSYGYSPAGAVTGTTQNQFLDPNGVPGVSATSSYAGEQQGLGGGVPVNAQQAAEDAFAQYRNSTGYQFRLNEGLGAITGNAAARGLLNSGSTLRGMTDFGQNAASQEFGNYLGQLGAVQATGLNEFGNRIGQFGGIEARGLDAAYNVASAGATGGSNAATIGMANAASVNALRRQGTQDLVGGLGAAMGGISTLGQARGWWN